MRNSHNTNILRQVKYICDETAVSNGHCKKEDIGKFVVQQSDDLYAPIISDLIDLKKPGSIHYPIEKSGYYCVSTYTPSDDVKYTGAVLFQNAFGHLAASLVPKLYFYAGAALAYLLVLGAWLSLYIKHRSDILPVQNYITAICGFLVVEMIVIWGYYDFLNIHGDTTGSKVYLVILSVFNSFRNAFTFFLLLIVCLGYGVVKPSLGNMMWKCRALAGAHFLFAILYTISSYVVPPDSTNAWVLFLVLPLSLTMTTFYIWILSSLTHTIKFLEERKQGVKASMYKNLWRLLLGSVLVIFGFFFLNSLIFANESPREFITRHWQSRWFMLDGWLNVVYFADFCIIAFIWRPTPNNRRFAMSSQLAQDENEAQEFEIGSLRGSFELDDDEEDERNHSAPGSSSAATPSSPPPQYAAATSSSGAVPAPIEKDNKRELKGDAASSSNAGETVFSVADNGSDDGYDKWDEDDDHILSDDDDDNDNDTEATGLRKKKNT